VPPARRAAAACLDRPADPAGGRCAWKRSAHDGSDWCSRSPGGDDHAPALQHRPGEPVSRSATSKMAPESVFGLLRSNSSRASPARRASLEVAGVLPARRVPVSRPPASVRPRHDVGHADLARCARSRRAPGCTSAVAKPSMCARPP
jgi:hypothetical protein